MRARPDYLPTHQQIAEACALIRQGWSPAERQRRMVGFGLQLSISSWQPPRINTSMCTARVRKVVAEATA